MAEIKTKFFKKVLASTTLVINHKAVPFELLETNIGVLKITDENPEDAQVIVGLEHKISLGIGGVMEITEEEYADLKKKLTSLKSQDKPAETLRAFQQPVQASRRGKSARQSKEAAVAPPAVAEDKPAETKAAEEAPSVTKKPRTLRVDTDSDGSPETEEAVASLKEAGNQ